MKTMLKTFVMFGLSACVLLGGALSSFAAEGGHYSVQLLGHQADSCSGTANAEIVVRAGRHFAAAGGTGNAPEGREPGREEGKDL